MRLADMMKKQGITKQTITKNLEAELSGVTLEDKELETLEKEDIMFDERTLEGKDLIVYSHSLMVAYRLKNARFKHIDQLAKVVPNMVLIVYK